ncbi:MAG TPA: multicopper oxidase domain-containing protein [Terriglobales bacterium]|nr:multicopper oxidase domain-containing protein [Terriglobales bacterium]
MSRLYSLLLACLLSLSSTVAAQTPAARANDNRVPAGTLRNGELTLRLEIVEALWFPQQEGGPHLAVYSFAEEGNAAQIPGPLLRVPQGTVVHATVRNRLPVAMFVFGLHQRPGSAPPLEVPPGAMREVRFPAGEPGTYFYEARSTPQTSAQLAAITLLTPIDNEMPQFGKEALLTGALIVDPPGTTADDRVFVINLWMTGLSKGPFREVMGINGRSWPHSERLTYRQGETVRWRVINATPSDHAMHLHGFFYRVNSLGDADRDRLFPDRERPLAVTQHMPPGSTMSLDWSPDRTGRWVFHCHMTGHMSDELDLNSHPLDGSKPPLASHAKKAAGMGGLVLGIDVLPDSGLDAAAATSDKAVRKLRLLIEPRPASGILPVGYGYKLEEQDTETPGPPPVPGAPLVLTRGQPVEITVVNRLVDPTAVHWHGMELESYYDGVPGWGGSRQITPPIAPGGSFVARFTPPRAGTYIYHTHWHDVLQLTGGLYGPLIVLEPGQKFDPETDQVFIIARAGPDESVYPLLLNGSPQPGALALKIGTRYRFRFINIATNDADAVISLRSDGQAVSWRAVGKDGAELPAAQAVVRTAQQNITVGETYDFEYIPQRPGDLTLEVWLPFFKTKLTQIFEVQP